MIGEVNNLNKRKKEVEEKLAVLDKLTKQRAGPVKLLDALANSPFPRRSGSPTSTRRRTRSTWSGSAESHEDVSEFMMRQLASMAWTPQRHGARGRAEARWLRAFASS